MKKKIVSFLAAAVLGLSLAPVATAHASAATTTAAPQVTKKTIPDYKGTAMDIKEAQDKIKAATEKLKTLDSAEITFKMEAAVQGADMSFDGDANVNIKEDKAFFKMSVMGQDIQTYYDNGTTYSLSNGTWTKTTSSSKEKLSDIFKDAEPKDEDFKMMDKYEAIKMDDGSVVIKNKEKLTSESLKDMLPKEGSAGEMAKTLEDMAAMNMELDFAMVIDKDDNFKGFTLAGSVDMEGTPASVLVDVELKNINSAAPILIPEEALNAEESATPSDTKETTTKAE